MRFPTVSQIACGHAAGKGRKDMNLFDLKGKVAVVTGGNGGIGLGMARGIASLGAVIVIAGRNADKAAAALAALRDAGAEAVFIAADVTRKAECGALIAGTVERYGRVDILVNNAGTSVRKLPQDLAEDEWHHVLDTNLSSAFFCSQAAYPEMVRAGGGKMINIGSMMSLFGAPYATAYAASKGGIVQMTRAMATAWAKDNIQVNAVLPGLDRHRSDQGRAAAGGGPARQRREAHPARPLGHAGRHGGDRGVPGQPGVGFRDRNGDPCGWRVFGRDVGTPGCEWLVTVARSALGGGFRGGAERAATPLASCKPSHHNYHHDSQWSAAHAPHMHTEPRRRNRPRRAACGRRRCLAPSWPGTTFWLPRSARPLALHGAGR